MKKLTALQKNPLACRKRKNYPSWHQACQNTHFAGHYPHTGYLHLSMAAAPDGTEFSHSLLISKKIYGLPL